LKKRQGKKKRLTAALGPGGSANALSGRPPLGSPRITEKAEKKTSSARKIIKSLTRKKKGHYDLRVSIFIAGGAGEKRAAKKKN